MFCKYCRVYLTYNLSKFCNFFAEFLLDDQFIVGCVATVPNVDVLGLMS